MACLNISIPLKDCRGKKKATKDPIKQKFAIESDYSKLHLRLNTNSHSCNANANDFFIYAREKESKLILNFLQIHINNMTTDTHMLYVYGPPGTGKTLTIRHVVDYFQNSYPKKNFIQPIIYINCMTHNSFKNVDALYQHIYSEIAATNELKNLSIPSRRVKVGKIKKPVKLGVVDLLKNISSKYPILLILDEIDSLKTPQKGRIRQFFDTSIENDIHFVIITVSNNFTFFKPKEIREYNIEKLNFKTYTSDQLERILQLILNESLNLVDKMALKLCSMRVAATTGDIRRALSILKTALEFNNESCNNLIDVKSVNMALEQIYGSKLKATPSTNSTSKSNFTSNSTALNTTTSLEIPFQQLLLLCCLLKSTVSNKNFNKNIKNGNATDTRFIYNYYFETCRQLKLEFLTYEEISQLLSLLESRGFIQLKNARKLNGGVLTVSLLISEQEITNFVSQNPILSSLFSF